MLETLLDTRPTWVAGEGDDADIVLYTQCMLVRNLADYPFPEQCSESEKKSIEERILSVIDNLNILPGGKYWSLEEMGSAEAGFLMERGLIPPGLADQAGAHGAYISEDQSISICVNATNHMTIIGLVSGLDTQEIWTKLSVLDDTFAGVLDYAFSDRLGYLTTELSWTGTGLKTTAVVHLPGHSMSNALKQLGEMTRSKRIELQPLFGNQDASAGDLFRLVNTSTLGQAEEEILFHLRQLVSDLVQQERKARKDLFERAKLQLEDKVERALGLAARAKILAFDEAISVLSVLRLGYSEGLVKGQSLHHFNTMLLDIQDAHLEMKCGHTCDEVALSSERADLFRERISD